MYRQYLLLFLFIAFASLGQSKPLLSSPIQSKPKKTQKEHSNTSNPGSKDPKAYSKTTESPNLIFTDTTKKSTKPSAKKVKTKSKKK